MQAGYSLSLSELLHLCGYTEHGYTCYGRQGTLSELLHLFEPTPLLMWLRTGQLSSLQGRLECVSATLLSLLQQHHPASGAVEHRSSEATLEGEAATVGAGAAAVGAGAAAKATGLLGRLREEGRGIFAELPPLPSLPSLPPLGSRGTPHTKAKRAAGHESNVEGGAEGGAEGGLPSEGGAEDGELPLDGVEASAPGRKPPELEDCVSVSVLAELSVLERRRAGKSELAAAAFS